MPSRLQGKTVSNSPAVGLPKEGPPNQSFRQSLKRKQSKPKKISRPALGDNQSKSHASAQPSILTKATVRLRQNSKRRLPVRPFVPNAARFMTIMMSAKRYNPNINPMAAFIAKMQTSQMRRVFLIQMKIG